MHESFGKPFSRLSYINIGYRAQKSASSIEKVFTVAGNMVAENVTYQYLKQDFYGKGCMGF
jgi:hypothetical protein